MPTPEETSSTIAALQRRLLGGTQHFSLRDLASRAQADIEDVRTYWRAIGLPADPPDDDQPRYTDADAQAVLRWVEMSRRENFDESTRVSLMRAVGHTAERLSFWQIESLVEHLQRSLDLDPTSARLLTLDRIADFVGGLEEQLVHAWRSQMTAVASRYVQEFASVRLADEPDEAELPLRRAVGFVDIVNFTRNTSRIASRDLADLVQRFESGARDIVTAHRGRVVKTIGDAVLFISDDAATAARIAVDLAHASGRPATASRGAYPKVRVSLVWGRVLPRFGDVFGPPVNLAARLNECARPGQVLIDASTAAALADDPAWSVESLPAVQAPGLGRIEPYELRSTHLVR